MKPGADIETLRDLAFPSGGPSAATRDRALADFLAAADRPPRRIPREGRGWTRQALVPSALMASVAVALAIVSSVGFRGSPLGADSAAAALLARAANAIAPPVTVPGPNEYLYTRLLETDGESLATVRDHVADQPFFVEVTSLTQIWLGLHGGVRDQRLVRVTFPTARDRTLWNRTHSKPPPLGRTLLGSSGALGPYTYQQMIKLPTNTPGLRAVIRRDAGHGSAVWINHEMFTVIHDILIETLVPVRLRAALYRVTATIPGVREFGTTRDDAGRRAVVISFDDPFARSQDELLFDPDTFRLLGLRELDTRTGTILEAQTLLNSRVVRNIDQRH